MKERCFADRKDGECHALVHKKCEGCRFYFPRKLLKDNPFYEYSFQNYGKMNFLKKQYKIKREQIMKKKD